MVLDSREYIEELYKYAFSFHVFVMPLLLKLISSEINYRSRVESEDFSAERTLSCRQAISLGRFPQKL